MGKEPSFRGWMVFTFAALAIGACDRTTSSLDCVCTEEFRTFTVTVVDGTGAPVDSMDVVVTRVRGDVDLSGGTLTGFAAGEYVVVDDGDKNQISTDGDAVRFEATRDGTTVVGAYVFKTDDCLCHVEKVRGPDTLVWSP